MTPIQAIGLGIIQGLTEFLPISSSGHLVLAQTYIKGFSQPGVLFDAILHGGTLFAIIWYFRDRILSLDKRMLWVLAVGTIPAGLAGLFLSSQIEGLFANPTVVGVALLATGTMNWLVDRIKNSKFKIQNSKFGWSQALVVGVFQAVAIIPGISRSGSTIFAGVAQGIKREDAAAFSFLLSIPAVAGAVGLQLVKYGPANGGDYGINLLGFITAALVGYFSISFLMRILLQRHFKAFSYYCFILGLTTLFLSFNI